jgi:TRAP-type transport system periplasmic protein
MSRSRCSLATIACAAGLLLVAPPAARSQTVLVKMATLVPDGSAWHTILKQMGEDWKTLSGGRVTLRLYAGGVAGDDADVVRKMRLGTLGGGVVSSVGLADVDRSVYALEVPMMYASYDELNYVLEKMSPGIEKAFDDKGFVILSWADGGWVHFFTKTPVRTPDDLKQLKLFAWAGDTSAVEIWKAAGFNPVPLPSTEISTALQTGLITALPTTAQAALLLQWYNQLQNMTDLDWAVLLGATVVTKPVWESIPAELRPALRKAAEEAGRKLREETRRRAVQDLQAMREHGLNVIELDPATVALWRQAAENAYPQVRGGFVPDAAFDEAMAYRAEYRQRPAAAASNP